MIATAVSFSLMGLGALVAMIEVFKYVKNSDPIYWRASTHRFDFTITIIAMLVSITIFVGFQSVIFYHGSTLVLAATAPFFEEPAKLFVVYLLVASTAYSRHLFKKRWLYYGILSGLAFGTIEYFGYVAMGFQGGIEMGLATALLRIPPLFLHALLASLDAYALLSFMEGKKGRALIVFLTSILTHMTTNLLNFVSTNNDVSIAITSTFIGILLLAFGMYLAKQEPSKINYDDFMIPILRYTPRNRFLKVIFKFLIGFYVPLNKYKRVCMV